MSGGIFDIPEDILAAAQACLDDERKRIHEDYESVFRQAMKKYRIKSPEDLPSDAARKKFFKYVDTQWKAKNESTSEDEDQYALQVTDEESHCEDDLEERCWGGYEPVPGKEPYSDGSCRKEESVMESKKKLSTKAIERLQKKALGSKRMKADYTSAIANNGDFVVLDRGVPVARLKKGTWETDLDESSEHAYESYEVDVDDSGTVASSEPNSAVGFRDEPMRPKHVDVLKDIEMSSGKYEERYRLFMSYPDGRTAFYPPPNQEGTMTIEELRSFPHSEEAVNRALDLPHKRPQHHSIPLEDDTEI